MNKKFDPKNEIALAKTIDDLAQILEKLFDRGFDVDEKNQLYAIFVEVDRVNGLKIEIRPKEHGHEIPHFHVRGDGVDASFAITTGELLAGSIDARKTRLLRWWYNNSQNKLITMWEQTRPSDLT
ncbi:MAG: DUF4160 domain-containing protein [Proteobacteria bacterium]|nr:DUF4160 domain-containing protein [Pseudomonadota bacterium]MBU2483432.1 DUF4160 domain-containing protein [Pseudomonadota bacterium]MBU2572753.1 DUF4160 domain-containing protein [Elusimicrobiota bacterium]